MGILENLEKIEANNTRELPYEVGESIFRKLPEEISDTATLLPQEVAGNINQQEISLSDRYEPNSRIETSEHSYETDDNGVIYKIDDYIKLSQIVGL